MRLRIKANRTNPTPFHDGMNEEKVRLHVDCGKCGHIFDQNLISSIDKGEEWFRSLTESEQRNVAKEFGYTFEIVGPNNTPYVRFKNGRVAYLINMSCPRCKTFTLAAIDFYEMQPARYIAALAALAEAEED